MSGPKCVHIVQTSLWEARWMNRNYCSRLMSEYGRMHTELLSVCSKLQDLGSVQPLNVKSAGQLNVEIEQLLGTADGLQAVNFCLAQKQRLESDLTEASGALSNAVAQLQSRFRAYPRARDSLLEERSKFESYARTAVPSNWPDAERARIESY